jgi:hypothetical protein
MVTMRVFRAVRKLLVVRMENLGHCSRLLTPEISPHYNQDTEETTDTECHGIHVEQNSVDIKMLVAEGDQTVCTCAWFAVGIDPNRVSNDLELEDCIGIEYPKRKTDEEARVNKCVAGRILAHTRHERHPDRGRCYLAQA